MHFFRYKLHKKQFKVLWIDFDEKKMGFQKVISGYAYKPFFRPCGGVGKGVA